MSKRTLMILGIVLVVYVMFFHKRGVLIRNTGSALPINLYTNGVANGNTNDVLNRRNFNMQPLG